MLNLDLGSMKTAEVGAKALAYGSEQLNTVIESADALVADSLSVLCHTIEDSKNSSLVSAGVSTLKYGVVAKVATIGLETALGAIGIDTSLDTLHNVSDLAIGAGATLVGAGIAVSAFSNRNKTADDMDDLVPVVATVGEIPTAPAE